MPIQDFRKDNTRELFAELWKYFQESPDPIPGFIGDDLIKMGVMLPSQKLLQKLSELRKSGRGEAAINTVRNFIRKVYKENDPYWAQAELVPTEILSAMREYHRKNMPKYPGHFDEVKSSISKGITEDYPYGMWNPQTNRIHLGEGNTRVSAASELDIPAIPLRIMTSGRKGYLEGIPAPSPIQPNQFGYIPSNLKPSQLGVDYYDTRDLVDSIQRFLK